MKMNTPASPPAHRLPVLTEVVQLSEHESTGWPDLGHDLPVLRNRVPEHLWGDGQVEENTVDTPPAQPVAEPSATATPAPVFAPGGRVEPVFTSVPPVLVAIPVSSPAAEPQPVAKAPAFASSWWSDDSEAPALPAASAPMPLPAPAPVVPAFTELQVVQRVLADLDRQLDAMFDPRVNDLLAPLLARMADTLVRELRQELSVSLHDMVARAVAIELARHPKNPGSS